MIWHKDADSWILRPRGPIGPKITNRISGPNFSFVGWKSAKLTLKLVYDLWYFKNFPERPSGRMLKTQKGAPAPFLDFLGPRPPVLLGAQICHLRAPFQGPGRAPALEMTRVSWSSPLGMCIFLKRGGALRARHFLEKIHILILLFSTKISDFVWKW